MVGMNVLPVFDSPSRFVLLQLGKPAEARPYAEQALRIAELTYGPTDQRVAVYLQRLGDIMRQDRTGNSSDLIAGAFHRDRRGKHRPS